MLSSTILTHLISLRRLYSFAVLFCCCRRLVVCRTVSSSLRFFFFLSFFYVMRKKVRDVEKEDEEEEQAVRTNVFVGIKATQCLLHRHITIQNNQERQR